MALARAFADSLACPRCKQRLVYFEAEQFWLCGGDRLRFRVENDVPILLEEEAEQLSVDDADRLMKLAKEQGLTSV